MEFIEPVNLEPIFAAEEEVMDTCLLNLADCGQDRICISKNGTTYSGESFDVITVFDGHGLPKSGKCHFIDCLDAASEADRARIWASPNPMESWIEYFNTTTYDHGTGAVCAIARIFQNRIETFTIGDATVLIFVDDALKYINQDHNADNKDEVNRLKETHGPMKFSIEPAKRLEVFGPNDIRQVDATCTVFYSSAHTSTSLAITQSLGHNNITGYNMEKNIIYYEPHQKVQVIVCSDGVMDMVCTGSDNKTAVEDDLAFLSRSSASEIAHWAKERWRQEWITHVAGYSGTGKQKFPENKLGQDDVSAATWTKK